jgi:hypothetical protein
MKRAPGRAAAWRRAASFAASKSTPAIATRAPSSRMRATLSGLAVSAANTVTGTPCRAPARASPWPKLPAEPHTSSAGGAPAAVSWCSR